MNGAPWWAVIAAGLTGAVIAFGGTLLSGWRQNRQGRREEWFRRVQWAQSLTATDNDAVKEAGYRIPLRLSQF